ncbi:hypothetical protein FHP25_12015 [Vineibacter terrae]|uniref:Outer membrane protein assembly factor BamE n=1 Tax=Vineibacter terrae TaxID=2586908 RepID=A0A5C8PPR5_9HYPH|nr:hypothetical protein [Vineibacter terrae]TXL76367.1 hypothetical protein FHP25_12015 [Vineibacter terrae]
MTRTLILQSRFFRGISAAWIVAGVAACSTPPPPPPPLPVAMAPKPVARPAPPKPPPAAQAAATEISFTPQEGPLEGKPTTSTVKGPEPQEATAPMPQQAPSLAGLSEDAVTRRFGPPATIRKTPSANVWTYHDQACTLDLFLFTDMRTGAQKVLTYQFGGSGRETLGERGCLERLGHNGKQG